MKVRELQEKLAKLDPNLDVIVYHEQSPPFEIEDVSTEAVTRSRDENGTAVLKFELQSKDRVAIVEVSEA